MTEKQWFGLAVFIIGMMVVILCVVYDKSKVEPQPDPQPKWLEEEWLVEKEDPFKDVIWQQNLIYDEKNERYHIFFTGTPKPPKTKNWNTIGGRAPTTQGRK